VVDVVVLVVLVLVVVVEVVVVTGTESTVNASGGTMLQLASSEPNCHISIAQVPPPFS
jgi:hypothetical protein